MDDAGLVVILIICLAIAWGLAGGRERGDEP